MITLSLAHARVLDGESAFFNMRRSRFLDNLLRFRQGDMGLVRSPAAPVYTFTQRELEDRASKWVWYLTPYGQKALPEEMTRMGLFETTAWVTTALNLWIERPDGFEKGEDGKYR